MHRVEVKGQKQLAPESLKTKKAREKLLKQWEMQDQKIHEEALKETVGKIHKWIAARASHRIALKSKDIRLFDQNQNAAPLSRKVQGLMEKIQAEFSV